HQTFVPYDGKGSFVDTRLARSDGRKESRMDFGAMGQVAIAMVTQVGLRILGAIILWIVGRMVIGVLVRLVSRSLTIRHVDATITRYLDNILRVVLNVALALAILSLFGMETTTSHRASRRRGARSGSPGAASSRVSRWAHFSSSSSPSGSGSS